MKLIKKLVVLISVVSLSLVGCSNKGDEAQGKEANKGYSYSYHTGADKVEVHVPKPPQRAVTLSQFSTEMLLALGLEDRMVGTALLDNPILPQYKTAYDKIPVLEISEGHSISKEFFLSLNPDFVSGWDVSLTPQTTGSPEELAKSGVAPFVPASLKNDATIETVYEDFTQLGKIFAVEEKANEVIAEMKKKIKDVPKIDGEKPKVLVYDSGTKDAFVMGSGLINHLITLAGGENIFGDADQPFLTVSFESILEKNPDVIVVVDYLAGGDVKEKEKFIQTHPALKEVDAIKNNQMGVIGLADLSPGVRNADAIVTLHDIFYNKKAE